MNGVIMLPEIVKLFFALCLIIFLLKLKVDLWLTLIIGSLSIGLLFNLGFKQIIEIWKGTILNFETIKLLSIVFIIYFLSIILKQLKNTKEW